VGRKYIPKPGKRGEKRPLGSYPGVVGDDLTKNNKTGFCGLPGGIRDHSGEFTPIHTNTFWWSSTVFYSDTSLLFFRELGSRYINLSMGVQPKSSGVSIRLIKD
jgi:uncharacterized protein (TIGR02145 family)